MGKSKKTRWRSFSFDGSKDETQLSELNDDATQNGIDSHIHLNTQKYSQILGDHHSNYSTQVNCKNSSSSASHHNNFKRSYNKENYYNQRSGVKNNAQKSSWQRSSTFRSSNTLKDKRSDENGKSGDGRVNSTSEPLKFNEDEYTRITTPRQDVLFKKGYLSRMNNKTAYNTSTSVVESTAPNSSTATTNSDPDSSVSTLSPATTPSMDYNADSVEYAPVYYPGYYDEGGMVVIPAMPYGYNYYSPNGSATTSPVVFMPYPYQFDPFFMAPNTEVSSTVEIEQTDESNDKKENEGAKENENIDAEEDNGARTTNSPVDDSTSNTSDKSEEKKNDQVDAKDETQTEFNDQQSKQSFPVYANELGYIYPAYPYNGFYCYNGIPPSRPPKMKRRKRFISSRSSNSNSHQPRSTETTTDYSDDENNSSHTKRYYSRQNGWMHHNNNNHYYHNSYNQYHYNSKFYKYHMDQNANQAQSNHESNLNVDVQEFYPRVQTGRNESKANSPNKDTTAAVAVDLEQENALAKNKNEAPKSNNNNNKAANITSQQSLKSNVGRVSKKELIEGVKSMEQQNINLAATKLQNTAINNSDSDWNVIKNGRKVKVVKDSSNEGEKSNLVEKNSVEEIKLDEVKQEVAVISQEVVKKPLVAVSGKCKKGKNKNKKKKPHLTTKQDGFEIIEPEFGNSKALNDTECEQTIVEASEEDGLLEECASDIPFALEGQNTEIFVPDIPFALEGRNTEIFVPDIPFALEGQKTSIFVPETQEAESTELLDKCASESRENVAEENVIDISDEEISCKTSVELNIALAQEIAKIESEPIKKENNEPISAESSTTFEDISYFSDHKKIADLERDLLENLKILDDGIDIKSPIINPLYDFPITSAVRKWLQEKQNESFDNLFHVQNFKKLSELYDDCDDESDISDSPLKSDTTDSDYASDIQGRVNGSPASSNAKIDTKPSTKCNKKLIVKESFCALM